MLGCKPRDFSIPLLPGGTVSGPVWVGGPGGEVDTGAFSPHCILGSFPASDSRSHGHACPEAPTALSVGWRMEFQRLWTRFPRSQGPRDPRPRTGFTGVSEEVFTPGGAGHTTGPPRCSPDGGGLPLQTTGHSSGLICSQKDASPGPPGPNPASLRLWASPDFQTTLGRAHA